MKDKALSVNKMNKLKELGIDANDASFCWVFDYANDEGNHYYLDFSDDYEQESAQPAYMLDDILEKLPDSIQNKAKSPSYLTKVSNTSWEYVGDDECAVYYRTIGEDLLDAAYKMLVWCLENGHIKNNKNTF